MEVITFNGFMFEIGLKLPLSLLLLLQLPDPACSCNLWEINELRDSLAVRKNKKNIERKKN